VSSENWSALLYAVTSRKRYAVKALLQSYSVSPMLNVFPSFVSSQVMDAAMEWGNTYVFDLLLLHGCGFHGYGTDVLRMFDVATPDRHGRTFLMRLCRVPGSTPGRLVPRLLMEEPEVR